ncbi:MAG: transposase family protein, partial [Caldilineaceae bacterium SB0666_bin_21]|nr:transposase family protein [Caldilineaceae bacterium SB0666_bin_21]
MDFILMSADPEGQRALPEDPGACPHCGASAWRRNGTYPRHLVVLGRLSVQRWQCKVCLGCVSPLPPDATSRQRPQTFRELVADLYVYSVSLRGLSRILALLGCGVGAATLWRDIQAVASSRVPDPEADLHDPQAPRKPWVEVDETWLSIGGEKRPVAVVLGPKGERLALRLARGLGGTGREGAADGRRTGLRAGPSGDGAGPAAGHCTHVAHRGPAHAPHRRRPDALGPGADPDSATPGAGATAGGGTHPARPLGIHGPGPRAAVGSGAQPFSTLSKTGPTSCAAHGTDMPAPRLRIE